MENREKIIARLAKIKALAKDGVGGERDAAAKLLEAVATKYGIDLDRIETDEEHEYPLDMKRGWKLDLVCQIIGLMRLEQYGSLDKKRCYVFKRTFRNGAYRMFARCTGVQWVEMNAKFSVLAKDYEAQLRAFFRAFLEANDLLVPYDYKNPPKPTKEEIEEAEIAHRMAGGIKKSALRKQIGEGDPRLADVRALIGGGA